MIDKIKKDIISILEKVGVTGEIELTSPPKREMGDLAFGCFALAKVEGNNPVEIAKELKAKSEKLTGGLIEKVEAFGPYVNFFLNSNELAKQVLENVTKEYGKNEMGKDEKVMVEFAHPNTHKAFHIGHLRNIITGESVVRILENAGYEVIRANYQGDVGMHIAKCLYGFQISDLGFQNLLKLSDKSLEERIKMIGEVYAKGSKAFEESEEVKEIVRDLNTDIYEQNENIKEIYQLTRGWSLEYFDSIYKRVGSHFGRLYFESEVFARGIEIVKEFVGKGVFKESEGAIIFPGSEYGLHDRVFITGKGYPTYEAKDLGLAELQFKEKNPDKIIHVVGKEQTDYFRVVFKALEFTLPESKGKEEHLNYGWVDLKHGKMSSRTGNVVLGEWLLDEVEKKVASIMGAREIEEKQEVVEKVGMAATKYAFLKTGVKNDIKFDLDESVRLDGDSGPYLLYIVARIKSILKKANSGKLTAKSDYNIEISESEKQVILKLSNFPEVTKLAAQEYDPSKIAKYLFELAQSFNTFYANCSVLDAESENIKIFRIKLIEKVEIVMAEGLKLLGIEAVEKM